MYFIKLANYLKHAESYDYDNQGLDPQAAALLATGSLGSLAAYGGVSAKRGLERGLVDSLNQNIRADELAETISNKVRAKEILTGDTERALEGLKNKKWDIFRAPVAKRKIKAKGSKSLLSIIKALQDRKIL